MYTQSRGRKVVYMHSNIKVDFFSMSELPILIGAEIDKYTIFDYIFFQNKMSPNLNRVLRVQYF